ncbi:PDK3 [Symbiodinium necroappetens]|uniref:PDK3 protein n=1 Tax=Symbiodinium necroappetens TaxID=1628268 RepID=A0A812QKY2_9DINO|nr:PDK3 [Symbiodinium necroappetens]
MHHYWVKEAGDPEAIGEYFPTGDERNGVPLYQNQNGLVLSREAHGSPEVYSWVIGSVSERRPLYGVKSDDLSAPTLGWQAFTAPEPVPVIRYFSKAQAACVRFVRSCVTSRSWRYQCGTTAIYNPKAKELTTFASQIFRREMLLIMSFS